MMSECYDAKKESKKTESKLVKVDKTNLETEIIWRLVQSKTEQKF